MARYDNPSGATNDGRKTVAAAKTRESLAIISTPCSYVLIQAETDNTGEVVVGGPNVVAELANRRGVALAKGDIVQLPADNLTDIFIDVTVNGDGVTFIFGVSE